MKRIVRLACLSVLKGIGGLAAPVAAAPPFLAPALPAREPTEACSLGLARTQFLTGYGIGSRVALESVAEVADCSQIGQVAQSVREKIDAFVQFPPGPVAPLLACRSVGFLDGLLGELDNQNGACELQCTVEGDMFGEISAEAYCVASIAFDGLEVPLERRAFQPCGPAYEPQCDAAFQFASEGFNLAAEVAGACLRFTQGEFSEVWVQSRVNRCLLDVDFDSEARAAERLAEAAPQQ